MHSDAASVGTKLPIDRHRIAITPVRIYGMNRPKTSHTVGRNVEMLIGRSGMDIQTVAARAGMSLRNLKHVREGRNTTTDSVDAIAQVFGLPGWLLLNPDLESDLANREWLERIATAFNLANPQGQQLLKAATEAAESMARDKIK